MDKSFFKCDKLENLSHVNHAFFTRNIKDSSNLYDMRTTLCPDLTIQEVTQNHKLVLKNFNKEDSELVILKQIHSNKVLYVTKAFPLGAEPQADAMVTDRAGIILAIITADCVPLLFADSKKNIIAAAHAGWKGIFAGVIDETIKKMQELGSKISDIHVTLGPCIHQESYEVGPEFYQKFLEQDSKSDIFFTKSIKETHYMFDLPGFVINRLKYLGLSDIYNINRDTLKEEQNFFSFRRFTLAKEPYIGNNLSVISLER